MTISALGSSFAFGYKTLGNSCDSAVIARNDGSSPAGPPEVHGRRRCATAAPVSSEATTALRYRRAERTALYIETQEGDVVRLRIKVRDSLTASSTSDGSAAEISVSSRSQTKISFQVEGNLNADELAAIQSVVEQAAELATDFFAGDLPEAFAAAAALDIDASELARVGLKLSLREQGSYSSIGTRPLPAAPPPTESAPATPATPTLPTAPVEGVESTGTTIPAEDAAAAETPPAPAPAEEPAAPTPPGAQPNVAGIALSLIADFLEGLLDTLAARPTGDDAESGAASLDVSLRLHIYRATLIEVAASRPTAEPETTTAVPLATDTLDALAAAHQPPLAAEA